MIFALISHTFYIIQLVYTNKYKIKNFKKDTKFDSFFFIYTSKSDSGKFRF